MMNLPIMLQQMLNLSFFIVLHVWFILSSIVRTIGYYSIHSGFISNGLISYYQILSNI